MTKEPQSVTANDAVVAGYDEYVMPIWKSLNVPVERAEDCRLYDYDGNEYLDVFSGISVANAGHNNEAVVEAAKDQLDSFVHGCSYVHPSEPVSTLAERLAEITPGDLQKSFFCNSGTEAVEGAIKLARKYTGGTEIVALEMGFHGRTLGSLALTGNHAYKHGMAPTLNDVVHAPAPYSYRSHYGDLPSNEFAAEAAAELERVIGTHTSGDLAAVVIEPVIGEGGIIVPPAEYLSQVQEIAHDHGGLLVLDEVQSGYGRTGEFWAADHFDITPDILTQAKGIANGLPLGAFTAPAAIADAFESGDHLSTFGGNPVCCAAALATIDELQDGLVDNARKQGEWLTDRLTELESLDTVGETRGLGLMQGVELVDPEARGPGDAPAPAPNLAKHVGKRLRERGIVMGVGGYYKNVIRFQPPLSIERAQLRRAVDELEEAIHAAER
ncbi:aspartate aminotransferase family protein [Haloarcula nitratireducens]|uniref:Aspartate aminotransferase family protein n=1 Tax=Haloarcula nitratireducens TaxID=2487749 RepID=A0AAW4PJK3_9EURY|nr:aspartate aminotransferase family protein [Halomicroarcula nitratireducens]MBX0297485.1 aspartate aminotransferase family protein [Halomicroarcula nitratireducens]